MVGYGAAFFARGFLAGRRQFGYYATLLVLEGSARLAVFAAMGAMFVAALMLRSGYGLLRESGRILLEASPRDLDPDEIGRALAAQNHVVEVHDLHVWEVTSGFPALAAHVLVGRELGLHLVLARIEGAPIGTKGISLFVVPKFLVNPDGSLAAFCIVCASVPMATKT
jgi:hypothetical protein